MTIINCDYCKERFSKKASQINRSIKHYCSQACRYQGRKMGVMVKCYLCSKEVYKSRQAMSRSMNKKYFCSKKCSNIWLGKQHSESNHPNWITGGFSYKAMMKRRSSNPSCVICGKTDTRILAIHHTNKNRQNNNPVNLAWLCHNCHFLVHHHAEEYKKFLSLINNAVR